MMILNSYRYAAGGGGGGHAYWRIYITAVQGGTGPNCSIGEMEFRATPGGADQASGGTAIANGFFDPYTPASAFDNSNFTRWASPGGQPSWLGYQFPSPVVVEQVAVRAPDIDNYASSQMIKDFEFQWSDDGSSWTTAATYSGESTLAALEQRLYSVPEP
jgi:hypothetical protein